jgi:hypothetical protein
MWRIPVTCALLVGFLANRECGRDKDLCLQQRQSASSSRGLLGRGQCSPAETDRMSPTPAHAWYGDAVGPLASVRSPFKYPLLLLRISCAAASTIHGQLGTVMPGLVRSTDYVGKVRSIESSAHRSCLPSALGLPTSSLKPAHICFCVKHLNRLKSNPKWLTIRFIHRCLAGFGPHSAPGL